MEEKFKIIDINKARRNDLILLAKLRLKNGARYNNLKLIFSIFCLHCSDLSENEGTNTLRKFGTLLELKEYDINNQIRSFIKNKEAFDNSGENYYHYTTKSIISKLGINKNEESYMTVLREDYSPLEKDNTTIIKKENIVLDSSLNEIITKSDDCSDYVKQLEIANKNEEEFSEELSDEDFLKDLGEPNEENDECPFDMD